MKTQMELTPHQLETWVAVLSCYPVTIVNRACLEIGLSEDPFPDLGKLTMKCETLRRNASGMVSTDGRARIGDSTLAAIATSLGLKI